MYVEGAEPGDTPAVRIESGVLTATVVQGQKIATPRIESDEFIMKVGNARPLEDATRIAFAELVLRLDKFPTQFLPPRQSRT